MRSHVVRGLIYALSLYIFSTATLSALDGIYFSACYRGKLDDATIEGQIQDQYSVGLYRSDITNGKIANTTRVCAFRSYYPMISPDGRQVAFYRQGEEVDEKGEITGGDPTKWYLSVMDSDGTKIRDLLTFAGDKCVARGDWPVGGWIYYHKPSDTDPTGSGEIWKVSVEDPTKNEMALNFHTKEEEEKFEVGRFSLNTPGTRVAVRMIGSGYGGNDAFLAWPLAGPDDHRADPVGESNDKNKGGRIRRCMVQLSASGRHMVTFKEYDHAALFLHDWHKSDNTIHPGPLIADKETATWAGTEVGGKGYFMRWSVNSDKWLIYLTRSGSVLVNWVGKTAIPLMKNTGGKMWSPGDFWLKTENRDQLELIDGTWLPYDAVEAADKS